MASTLLSPMVDYYNDEEELDSVDEDEDRSFRGRDSEEGTLQEYQKRMKKLDQQYKERLRNADLFLQLETEQVERNYIKEKKAAVKEFDDKKVELKENLIAELEEKKKMIENEKLTMELTGASPSSPEHLPSTPVDTPSQRYEARIEEGKLYYDKRWYHKSQAIYLESKENTKISCVISSVGTNEVRVRFSPLIGAKQMTVLFKLMTCSEGE
ncbi:sin3 histone deacetylase corepressor complex component SDS3 isoform X1 [Labeo rohita]|uniref:Sin3 histone deacetylase corepressor complex component SDS3 isoform X1 n=1 Tax=Labeo rohita TaxID=84645 RepID=A0A498LJJ5_LABRO|nr:sin3 histone deacetylase corepressor complex component SDS3 isoform X1 [Labeo rohita]